MSQCELYNLDGGSKCAATGETIKCRNGAEFQRECWRYLTHTNKNLEKQIDDEESKNRHLGKINETQVKQIEDLQDGIKITHRCLELTLRGNGKIKQEEVNVIFFNSCGYSAKDERFVMATEDLKEVKS